MVKTAPSMRSRNRSKINSKVALSCWFPFLNTVPSYNVETVPKHNLVDAVGCASLEPSTLVMVGCCQRGLQLLSVMFSLSVTCANKIQRS